MAPSCRPHSFAVWCTVLCGLCCTACSQDQAPRGEPSTGAGDSATAETPASTLPAKDAFVVMTWNLEWFYDDDTGDNFGDLPKQQSAPSRSAWEWRRDAFADKIAEAQPDVLAVQEVEGQRTLYYLTRALERRRAAQYSIGFAEGGDYFTEQDVGFLYRAPLALTRLSRHQPSIAMRESGRFGNVTKHVEAVFEVPAGDSLEKVTVLTLHFRAGADTVDIRTQQARSVHAWLADRIAAGENVIVLGDTNTHSTSYPPSRDSDIAALAGKQTTATNDDLIDLSQHLPSGQRQTHLLGKHFDRILVSQALLDDTPGRPDLVFESVARPQQLAVRGAGVDAQDEHWDRYWELPETERDLSDHWPLVARFTVK